MPHVTCPTCQATTQLPDGLAPGERFHCVRCGQRLALSDTARTRLVVPTERPAALPPGPPPLPRRPAWRCWRCGGEGPPGLSREMCSLSWMLVLGGLILWPLLVVGILLREVWRVCPDCGAGRKVSGPYLGW